MFRKPKNASLLVVATPQRGNNIAESVIEEMFNSPDLANEYCHPGALQCQPTTQQLIDSFYAVVDNLDECGPKRIFHFILTSSATVNKGDILWDGAMFLVTFLMSQGHQTLLAHHYIDDDTQHFHLAVNPVSIWGKYRLPDSPETYQWMATNLGYRSPSQWTWRNVNKASLRQLHQCE